MVEAFKAFLMAGLPMFILTYALYVWTLKKGIIPEDDDLSNLAGSFRKQRAAKRKAKEKSGSLLHDKWFSFGGGFYGLMAFITYVVIELGEIVDFFKNFTGIMDFIERISVSMIVDFIISSIMNFVAAMVWFTYWPDVLDIQSGWVWLGIAYFGYWLGIQMAQDYARDVLRRQV